MIPSRSLRSKTLCIVFFAIKYDFQILVHYVHVQAVSSAFFFLLQQRLYEQNLEAASLLVVLD